MEFKIVDRYYPAILTNRLQLCETKHFFKKIQEHKYNWQHNNTSSFPDFSYMFKVSNRNIRKRY